MSARRLSPASATYAAAPLPDGGWRITIPGVPPSQNALDREHWTTRRQRVLDITSALLLLRKSYRLAPPVFERAEANVRLCYEVRRRRDVANGLGGLKQHVDGLTQAGWLLDDDTEHLRWGAVDIAVERPGRVEFTLRTWGR